jgi:hypothetical protein
MKATALADRTGPFTCGIVSRYLVYSVSGLRLGHNSSFAMSWAL